jgi:murein L,D-transpeptidase YafK
MQMEINRKTAPLPGGPLRVKGAAMVIATRLRWFGLALGATAVVIAFAISKRQPPEPDRVAKAREGAGAEVKRLCQAAGVHYPPRELYLRAFKREAELECWARGRPRKPMALLKTFPITSSSGRPGPKRREGDRQVPEGFYQIDLFNPNSSFHLSMRVDYPNASDRILSDREKPGFDIYVHGGSGSIGCLPLGDEGIEQLYLLASDVKANGRPLPIHIFPARMRGGEWEKFRADEIAERPELAEFWEMLQPAFDAFENRREVPAVEVAADGKYVVR